MLFINTSTPLKEHFDYHIHTSFSDGKNSIEECVCSAIKKGLSEIAITDHVWYSSNWIKRYVEEIRKLQKCYQKIKILIGAEAKAINLDGDVDIKDKDLEKLDFLIGSVHKRLIGDVDKKFSDLSNLNPQEVVYIERDIIAAMANNSKVDVIGHPMRLYYKFIYLTKTDALFPLSVLKEILTSTKKAGKLIELNFKVPNFEDVLKTYCQSDAHFTLGSDAHNDGEIGNIPYDRIIKKCQEEYRL